jgi:hypothetical protein
VPPANYPGMTVEPGPGLLHREAGALDAAEEVTARGVAEARDAGPTLSIAGATEVTSPSRALTEASRDAALVVLGSRGYGRVVGALLGSVAFVVAARASYPVIVLRRPDCGHITADAGGVSGTYRGDHPCRVLPRRGRTPRRLVPCGFGGSRHSRPRRVRRDVARLREPRSDPRGHLRRRSRLTGSSSTGNGSGEVSGPG